VRYEDVISIDTPEGVPLELTLAGVGSRFLAAIVDTTIQFATLLLIVLFVSLAGSSGPVTAVGTILAFLVFLGYDILFETKASGRTPGKRLTGLRVVRRGGGPVGFRTSAVRNLLRVIDLLPGMYLVGIVCVLVTKQNQRLGDLAAGTIVLRERTGLRRPTPTTFAAPTGLDAYTDSLDLAGLGADEYGLVRAFLLRAPSLPPAVRAQLAAQVGETIAKRVQPPPPPGVPAELFLASVAAAYRKRGS